MTKPIPAREVKPGMFIRRPEAVSTSPYAAFREVDRTHNVGIYSQIDIGFVDGTGDTWSLDAEFEVQSDAERATDVAVATVYARLLRRMIRALAARPARPTRPALPIQPADKGQCTECQVLPGVEHELSCPEVSFTQFQAFMAYRVGGQR